MARRIAILGSTGSIGRQTLEVAQGLPDVSVCGLAAGSNWRSLAAQAHRARPQFVAIADESSASKLQAALPAGIDVLAGPDGMTELVHRARPDVLLSGVVGTAGLSPTLAGIECGSTLAIANKETLVMAGAIIVPAARAAGVRLLPVDSEHSAVFQCLLAGRRQEVRGVVITASGGALRDWEPGAAAAASVEDALKHPTWSMGQKVTIDSATLINKALEVIEAHWLFDLPADQIDVVLHDESIVHAYVTFCDGSVIAQMGPPSMTTPIAYALGYPQRPWRDVAPLDLPALGSLTFRRLSGRFERALNLGYEAIHRGGLAGAVLNSANEAAVSAFLAGRIRFGEIVPLVEQTLGQTPVAEVTLQALIEADQWARRRVEQLLGDRQDCIDLKATPRPAER